MPLFRSEKRKRRWKVEDVTMTKPSVIKRAIGAAAIGNVTEWYDFGVYGYLQVIIAQVFLPKDSGVLGAVIVAAIFASGFLVRPIGGTVFGLLSDKIGRNKVLATTMIMMAAATFAIGWLPTYQSIGVWASLLLLMCRLVQGFSTGGEYGNAMTFIAEYAPDKRRGFLGSLLEVGTFGGYLLGAGFATVLTVVIGNEGMTAWGWRIPFFVSLPLGIVGIYLRTRMSDTPAFQKMDQESEKKEKSTKTSGQFKKIFALWPNLLACCGLVIAWNVPNYMLTSYMPTFFGSVASIKKGPEIDPTTSQILQIIVLAVSLLLIPLLGKLSDRMGRKFVVRIGSIGLIVLSFPAVWLVQENAVLGVLFGLILMGLCLICFSSTMPSTLPSLFPTAVRAAALSIAFNVSISLFGGTTSTVMTALVGNTHFLYWPAVYLVLSGLIGLLAIHWLPESNGKPLWGSTPSATSKQEAKELVEELAAQPEK